MELVSVVIPVYNTEPEYLSACLDSVLQQSYPELELILVNDKSTNQDTLDTLDAYVAKDKRVKLVHNEKNSGPGISRNAGVDQATGKYLTLLDSDDRFTPNFVEKMVQALEQNQTELAICVIKNFTVDPQQDCFEDELAIDLPNLPYVDMQEFLQQKKLFLCKACPYGRMIRLDVYRERHMEFDPKIPMWEDFEWAYRIMLLCKNFSFVDFVGVKRLVHTGSISQIFDMKTFYNLFNVYKYVYVHLKQNNLLDLYYDQCLLLFYSLFLSRFEKIDNVGSVNILNLVQLFKSFLESCGYIFNKDLSKLDLDPETGSFILVFQHVNYKNNPISLKGKPTMALFIQIWKTIC